MRERNRATPEKVRFCPLLCDAKVPKKFVPNLKIQKKIVEISRVRREFQYFFLIFLRLKIAYELRTIGELHGKNILEIMKFNSLIRE